MDQNQMSQSPSTGTRDSTYNLTAVLYHALQGVENTGIYLKDAAEGEQRRFLQMAHDQQRQIAEQAKKLLHDALMRDIGRSGDQSSGSRGGFSRDSERGQDNNVATGQSHSFSEARDDNSAFRFASERTEGGSDQFAGGSDMDWQGGSALTSGQQVGGQGDDPQSASFGQSALGQGQRHDEMTTGGGGTSSF